MYWTKVKECTGMVGGGATCVCRSRMYNNLVGFVGVEDPAGKICPSELL